ncbi:MAG: hypothetical protein LBM77_00935 [Spirochaetaceae bacterium]|jgi:hypothetical protein|nr:hypothetical protein [Spirochaetaceae bacterium]
MSDYDFFELTGLPFDPPTKKVDEILEAVGKKKTGLEGLFNSESQPLKKAIWAEQKDFLKDKLLEIIKENKITAIYTELAEARTKKGINNLTEAVRILKQHGRHIATIGEINSQSNRTKLSKQHVEQIYLNLDFTITKIEPLKTKLEFPNNADTIFEKIEALSKETNKKPGYNTSLAVVTDLYSLTAYMAKEPENSEEYRSKPAIELKNMLKGFYKDATEMPPNISAFFVDLTQLGASHVFDSEKHREGYDTYLKYKSPELTKLFNTLKQLPQSSLLDNEFADACIKEIFSIFNNYEIALNVYNSEAGLQNSPYLPQKAIFPVKCSNCQNIVEFEDESEAKKINECAFCHKSLYKQCSKCHKLVLVSLDKCPECGFVFASAALFAKYYAAAEQALRQNNFESARKNLFDAQTADPSEKARIAELEARIASEEKKFETKASLAKIQAKFDGAKNLSSSKKADICIDILKESPNFQPAGDFLRATPPEPCKSFTIGLDTIAGNANLSWPPSGEKGVTYRILRKPGKDLPVNGMDGEILLDNSNDISFRDKTIQPGRYYSYAVCAIRYGIFSSIVGKAVFLLADITNLHGEQLDKTIRLTWDTPRNCTGVSITRTSEGKTETLTNCATGSYEDTSIKFGVAYTYRLCANYTDLPPSMGLSMVITPTIQIKSFSIQAEQLSNTTCKISWDIAQSGIALRILVDEKLAREVKSDTRSCEITLAADGFKTVAVLAHSGGEWLRSLNDLQINTYSPLIIDKSASQLRDEAIVGIQGAAYNVSLHIKITGAIPKNVTGFYYTARTKSSVGEKAPWASQDEIGIAADIHKMVVSAYQNEGKIIYTERSGNAYSYYVSLFTIYNFNGKEVVSGASKCRFDRPLNADIFWRVGKNLFGGLKLYIEIRSNRSFERIPELVLCACPDGMHLLSANDPKGQKIETIPELKMLSEERTYSNSYDIKSNVQSRMLKGMKLFLFESAPVANENYVLHWAKDFNGKI